MEGFQLLKTRSLNEKVNIDAIEARYSIQLPPLFRIFCETFELGENSIITDVYINPNKIDDFRHCSLYVYEPNREVMFAGFNSLEDALENSENMDEWVDNGYIPIGNCGFKGGILLGTKEGQKDEIILHDIDGEVEFMTLANNIFEFTRGLVLEPIKQEDLVGGIKFSQLYKKWGEDYWRF